MESPWAGISEEVTPPIDLHNINSRNLSILLKSNKISPSLMEEFLANMSPSEKYKFTANSGLQNIIQLPRYGHNCNEDLVKLYFS